VSTKFEVVPEEKTEFQNKKFGEFLLVVQWMIEEFLSKG
jgi:hypothetical protein